MAKKVEVCMINIKAGHTYLIKGEGEWLPLDDVYTEKGQIAIFHAKHYAQEARANWYIVNLWTGLHVTKGSTRKQCLENLNEIMPQYVLALNNLERLDIYRKYHEELEKLKEAEHKAIS